MDLKDHYNTKSFSPIKEFRYPLQFIDVPTNYQGSGKRETNLQEKNYIEELIYFLIFVLHISCHKITVLTPYRDQKYFLQSSFSQRFKEFAPLTFTVDEFQGKENDVVLVSLTSFAKRPSGFLCDPRRVNVLTSRAKKLFIVFGNLSTFENAPQWEDIIKYFPSPYHLHLTFQTKNYSFKTLNDFRSFCSKYQ